jgi:hypothetical protein
MCPEKKPQNSPNTRPGALPRITGLCLTEHFAKRQMSPETMMAVRFFGGFAMR